MCLRCEIDMRWQNQQKHWGEKPRGLWSEFEDAEKIDELRLHKRSSPTILINFQTLVIYLNAVYNYKSLSVCLCKELWGWKPLFYFEVPSFFLSFLNNFLHWFNIISNCYILYINYGLKYILIKKNKFDFNVTRINMSMIIKVTKPSIYNGHCLVKKHFI